MLLQMVFEKLTKMAYCLGGSTFPREHGCVEYLIRVLKRSPQRKAVYLPNRDVLELVLDLEALNSSVAKAKRALDPSRVVPQLEYPWEDMDAGRVMSPATDLRILARLQHPRTRPYNARSSSRSSSPTTSPTSSNAHSPNATPISSAGITPPTLSTRPSRESSTFVGRVSVLGS